MSSVAAIILAAGSSSRLGVPKQLVRMGGETLLQRSIRVAVEAGLDPVLAVVAADLPHEPFAQGILRVVNGEAAEGMASSIRAGVKALMLHDPAAAGVIVLACDQPAVTSAHLLALLCDTNSVTASSYAGRRGVPAYFPQTAFASLLALRGDAGARDLLRLAGSVLLANGELDVDTVEDLAVARALFEDGGGRPKVPIEPNASNRHL